MKKSLIIDSGGDECGCKKSDEKGRESSLFSMSKYDQEILLSYEKE